jgi:hypothetical protein
MRPLWVFLACVACCSAFAPTGPHLHLRSPSRYALTRPSGPSALKLGDSACHACTSVLDLEMWFLVGYVLGPVFRRLAKRVLHVTNLVDIEDLL